MIGCTLEKTEMSLAYYY